MFDSFHHLLDPGRFVRTWGRTTPRFFLIEPGGDWLGGWQRTLDLDWIVPAIDTIRSRIVWQMGEDGQPGSGIRDPGSDGQQAGLKAGATTASDRERRRSGGASLHARRLQAVLRRVRTPGAGNDRGRRDVSAGSRTAVRRCVTSSARRPTTRSSPSKTCSSGRISTMHAKHWAIYAERGAPHAIRTPRPIQPRESEPARRLEGPYDVEYVSYDGGHTAAPGTTLLATVSVPEQELAQLGQPRSCRAGLPQLSLARCRRRAGHRRRVADAAAARGRHRERRAR